MSAGVNAYRLGENKDLSWSSGGVAESHRLYLQGLLNHPVEAINVAVVGSTAANLPAQLQMVLPTKPDYLTITVGANDICSWDELSYDEHLARFQDEVSELLWEIERKLPQTKVLLVSIPDMIRLRALSLGSRCRWVWELAGICGRLLGTQTTSSDLATFRVHWQGANDALRAAASLFDNVRFADVSDVVFEKRHVSRLDCFHPSAEGQVLLAQQTWERGWFTSP